MILFGKNARQKLLEGSEILYRAVSTTLSPKGRNVGIDRGYQNVILHDGVSVAKSIQVQDKAQQFAIDVLTESAKKTVQECGDGTTATIILAHSILKHFQPLIESGENPMSLRSEIEDAVKKITTQIDAKKRQVKKLDDAIRIATISAEDEELGKLVATTVFELGDGLVTVEESKGSETFVEKQEGMMLEKGYISPYFITNPMRMEAHLENPKILVCDQPIYSVGKIVRFIEDFLKNNRSLVIYAPEVTGDALASLIRNKLEGIMISLCIKVPYEGEKQRMILEDICAVTGATLLSESTGVTWENAGLDILGSADIVSAKKDTSMIIGGKGSKEEIDGRINEIKTLMKDSEGWELKKLEERLAKLTSGVSVIRVGGHTEIEMNERKERVIDAVEATKIALRDGIVGGGETVYLGVTLGDSMVEKTMQSIIQEPFKKMMENAGLNAGQMLERLKNMNGNWCVDVTDGQIKDVYTSGIIDPVSVSISALKNASSVAIQILTTDCLILPDEEKK